jgi:anti-sigma regulatory factor (Ser/Thr protein kinase)
MRSVALALQHSLLPSHLPTIDGAAVQVGYSPGDESDVGGDLYDVMELSSGRIGIAIGDVQGRGAHAAAVMGQLRAALRAYAVLDLEPAQVLTHLDDLVQGLNEALLVTCVYAVYDPFTRECVLANAGHPPPLLTGAHGCHPMEVPPDVPLGVGGIAFNDHAFTVAPGDTIVLYTDGVVERRGQSVDQGVRALCDALEAIGPGASPTALCRATLRASSGPLDDDRAVLAMRTDLDPLPLWRIDLPADPASPSAARSHARSVLREWSSEELSETVELLVSELVTNAVRHASGPGPTPRGPMFDDESSYSRRHQDGDASEDEQELDLGALERALLGESAPDGLLDNAVLDGAVAALRTDRRIEVVMRRGGSSLLVEVHDQDVRTPRVRTASANDEGGRGLFLVDQLSRRWGVRPTPTGKAVWFQLPLKS